MKKLLVFLLIALISLGVFAQSSDNKDASQADFSSFGISSITFPTGWNYSKQDTAGIYLVSKLGVSLEYKKYPYSKTGGPTYNDYSELSDDTKNTILKAIGDDMVAYYFDIDYDVNVTKSELVKINNKTFMHVILDGMYWDYEYEDYDYDDIFEEDMYFVLNKGYVHSFIFSVDYDYFSDDEEKSNADIISSIKFKK